MTSPAADNHSDLPAPAVTWVTSSFSFSNGNCVQVARLPDGDIVGVRHSRDTDNGLVLRFTPEEWTAFVAGVKTGEFDSIG
jgi:hypothetical protein